MYARPARLDDALRLLTQEGARVLAGGTDVFPAAGERPPKGNLVDITRLGELRGLRQGYDHLRIGALTTWRDLAGAALPPAFRGLQAAAREIGAVQIQNRATLAGNLCNASPAADGVPPLLVVDAEVELVSMRGTRRLPLEKFITGNRRTRREPDELLAAVLIPRRMLDGRSAFVKLGTRRYLVISIVMAAVWVDVDAAARVAEARVAVGACSAVAQRLPAAEAALIGGELRPDLADRLTPEQFGALTPLDDVRATAAYRMEAARTLVRRAIEALSRGEAGGIY